MKDLSADAIRIAIEDDGCAVIPGLLTPEYRARAKRDLGVAIEREAAYHGGTAYTDYGMVLVCSIYGGAFLELFDQPGLLLPFDAVLGPGNIVYAYTSSSMPPGKSNYSRRIHRDCPRMVPGYPTNMGATILLDDFTEENGATWYLPGSHRRPTPPSDTEFTRDAKRLVAPAGSVFFFDALLWHAGGENRTSSWRHALTLNMCRPFMKQRLDIPRMMAQMDLGGISSVARQKLGFLAQVPASLDEYYAPLEQRKYRQSVE